MGTLVLVTWRPPRQSPNLQGFPLTSCLATGQEVKGNLPNGPQMAKIKLTGVAIILLLYPKFKKRFCLLFYFKNYLPQINRWGSCNLCHLFSNYYCYFFNITYKQIPQHQQEACGQPLEIDVISI